MPKVSKDEVHGVPPKTEWMGAAISTAMIAIKGINFTLQQMVIKTAARLDVPQSAVKIHYGRYSALWGWCATVTHEKEVFSLTVPDPMHALAALVDKIERGER